MRSILIIQPGAFGDSILTVFLADALRVAFPASRIIVAGHKSYCHFMPERTTIDRFLDIDNLPLHYFFAPMLGDDQQDSRGPLALSGHDLIISFLFDESGLFRDNIIARNPDCIYCPLKLRPDPGFTGHVTTSWLSELAMAVKEIARLESKYLLDNDRLLSCGQIPSVSGNNLIKTLPEDQKIVEKLMDSTGIELLGRDLVVIHPGSGGINKSAPLEWYLHLATKLSSMGAKPVFVLGPAEAERNPGMRSKIASVHSVLPEIDTEVLTILLGQASCYFGNDSGPSHLAGAIGTANVTIFGPTNPIQWRPLGQKNSVINFGKVYNP